MQQTQFRVSSLISLFRTLVHGTAFSMKLWKDKKGRRSESQDLIQMRYYSHTEAVGPPLEKERAIMVEELRTLPKEIKCMHEKVHEQKQKQLNYVRDCHRNNGGNPKLNAEWPVFPRVNHQHRIAFKLNLKFGIRTGNDRAQDSLYTNKNMQQFTCREMEGSFSFDIFIWWSTRNSIKYLSN